jgi:hypothetical protein
MNSTKEETMSPVLTPSVHELEAEREELRKDFEEADLRRRAVRFDLRTNEARALRRLNEISYLLGE